MNEADVVNKIMEITPAGLGGYGLALTVLVVVCVYQYRRNLARSNLMAKKDQAFIEFMKESLSLDAKIEVRLSEQMNMVKDLDKVKIIQENHTDHFKTLIDKADKLLSLMSQR